MKTWLLAILCLGTAVADTPRLSAPHVSVSSWTVKAHLGAGTAEVTEDIDLASSQAGDVKLTADPPGDYVILNNLKGGVHRDSATSWTIHMRSPGPIHVHYHATQNVSTPVPGGLERWTFSVRPPMGDRAGKIEVQADPAWAQDDDHRYQAEAATGHLEPVGMTIQMQGTHRLMGADGHVIALLVGQGVDLAPFEGKTVQVVGHAGRTVENGTLILHVRQVYLH
ncbi:MAG TPA: hypothetical protein VGO93_14545 [Candidatus Xenobia bacterium]|jgi:hypothetical protein